jgi:hypothetical protein
VISWNVLGGIYMSGHGGYGGGESTEELCTEEVVL